MLNGDRKADLLDVVALLADRPAAGLARGQVGAVVEVLDENTVLVEFSGEDGRAYAIEPLPRAELLVLHYVPEAAE
jgi:membrane protein implicated in regulation of membrane protease activity